MDVFRFSFFLCLCIGNPVAIFSVSVQLNFKLMSLKDNFGGETNLLLSGRELIFSCACNKECSASLKRDSQTISPSKKDKNPQLPLNLTHTTEFGAYMCKAAAADGEQSESEAFHLKYLLCEDDSDLCSNLSCSKTTNDGNDFKFCVIKADDLKPSCEPLTTVNCPKGFGLNVIGYACCENGQTRDSVCHAFAEQLNVLYTSTSLKSGACNTNLLKVTSELKRPIYLGSIGEFGSAVHFSCDQDSCPETCCREDTWQQDAEILMYCKKKFDLTDREDSSVSRITCKSDKFNKKIETYFYHVRFSISMNFTEIPGKLSCKLDKPPVDNQKRIFAYYIKIFRDNKEVENTTTQSSLTVDKSTCGVYNCTVWMRVKMCNPFFEKSDSNSSVKKITEECTTPSKEDDDKRRDEISSTPFAGDNITMTVLIIAGIVAAFIVVAGLSVWCCAFKTKSKRSGERSPRKSIKSRKSKKSKLEHRSRSKTDRSKKKGAGSQEHSKSREHSKSDERAKSREHKSEERGKSHERGKSPERGISHERGKSHERDKSHDRPKPHEHHKSHEEPNAAPPAHSDHVAKSKLKGETREPSQAVESTSKKMALSLPPLANSSKSGVGRSEVKKALAAEKHRRRHK